MINAFLWPALEDMDDWIGYTKLLPIIFPILQPTRAHPVYLKIQVLR